MKFRIVLRYLVITVLCGITRGEAIPHTSSTLPQLPKPSGHYAVGRQAFDWVDPDRIDDLSSAPGKHREIMVYVWYPALPSKDSVAAEYFPGASVVAKNPTAEAVGREMFGPIWAQIVSGKLYSHASANVLPAKNGKRFPVILFSHGSSSTGFSYTAQIENFVSHGYVVVMVEHPGGAGLVRFSDGRTRLFQDPPPASKDAKDPMKAAISSAEQGTQTGAEDLRFVVNALYKRQVDISSIMNLNQIAAVGHSAGGTITARLCQIDPRIKACISEDGQVNPVGIFFDYPDHSRMSQPFLMIQLDEQHTDEELSRMGESRAQWDQYLAHGREQMKSCGAGSYQVMLNKLGLVHPSFSDGLLLNAVPMSPEAFSATENLELTERLEMDFLDHIFGIGN